MTKSYFIRVVSDILNDGENWYENDGYWAGKIVIPDGSTDDEIAMDLVAYLSCTGTPISRFRNLRFDGAYLELYDADFSDEVPRVYLLESDS